MGAALAACALAGCAESRPAHPSPPVAAPAGSQAGRGAGWDQGKWGTFHSQRFDLRLPLPDGAAWRIDDHKGSWLPATHPPPGSTLRLRMVLESHALNRAKCEAVVREAERALPVSRSDQVIEDVASGGPPGWDTHVVTFVQPDRRDETKLTGQLLAFASNVRKCLGFHFVTDATGADARPTVAARLSDAKERIVRELSFDQDLGVPGREALTEPRR